MQAVNDAVDPLVDLSLMLRNSRQAGLSSARLGALSLKTIEPRFHFSHRKILSSATAFISQPLALHEGETKISLRRGALAIG